MISFVNLSTGVVETPSNQSVVEQYKKRPDLYRKVCDIIEKDTVPKTVPKKEKRKRR